MDDPSTKIAELKSRMRQALQESHTDPEHVEAMEAILDGVVQGDLNLSLLLGVSEEQMHICQSYAVALFNNGKAKAACDALKTILMLNPYNLEAWRSLGIALQELESWDDALDAYNAALAIYPDDVISLIYKGQVLARQGQDSEGARSMMRGVEIGMSNPDLQPWIAQAREFLKMYRAKHRATHAA